MPINVMIFEDNADYRKPLVQLIEAHPELKLAGAYAACWGVLQKIEQNRPDIILMDIELPGDTPNKDAGIDATRKVYETHKNEIDVIMLTALNDDQKIFESICAGANGYLVKGISNEDIVRTIKTTYDGGSNASPEVARRILEFLRNPVNKRKAALLSPREFDVLNAIRMGLSVKMIAQELNLATGTVQTHTKNIYKKLKVNNKVEAVNTVFFNPQKIMSRFKNLF